jgi:hypothetical protein
MTLNELIKRLQDTVEEHPRLGKAIIVMSSDPEGNSFCKMSDNFLSSGKIKSSRHNYVEYFSSDDLSDFDEEDLKKLQDAIVLWP